MFRSIAIALLLFSIITLSSWLMPTSGRNELPYPEGYRNWTHVKTTISKSGVTSHMGFQHIYANEKALAGYAAGHFANGSVFAFDVLESLEQPNGNLQEGGRKLVDVMIKDSSKYSATGGWGFEEFKGDSKTDRVIKTMAVQFCFNCHATAAKTDFVFSKYRP